MLYIADTAPATPDLLEREGFSIKETMLGTECSILLRPYLESQAIVELTVCFGEGVATVMLDQGVPDDPNVVDDLVCLTSLPPVVTMGQVRRLVAAMRGDA